MDASPAPIRNAAAGSGRRASLFALGCRLNQAELGLLADQLRAAGFAVVPWGEPADLLVVNSCTVTVAAAAKTRTLVRRARREHPGAYIVLTGCDATVAAAAWADDGAADLVVPNPDKHGWLSRLDFSRFPTLPVRTAPAPDITGDADEFSISGTGFPVDKTRANLKIQEGCNAGCAYCIIPEARGRPRSRAFDDVRREVRSLAAAGCREIILTGINIGLYGSQGRRLPDLLAALVDIPGEFRLRLSSLEPGPCLPDVIELMAAHPGRICPHLHLPVQYAEDTILKAMRRPYGFADFAAVAETAMRRIPNLCFGTDVIVGFPGETDALFSACFAHLESLPLAYLHVFTFSPRPGTVAATLPGKVHGTDAKRRAGELEALARRKSDAYIRSQCGGTVQVLVEETPPGKPPAGTSENFLEIELEGTPPGLLRPNTLVAAVITAPCGLRRARAQFAGVTAAGEKT